MSELDIDLKVPAWFMAVIRGKIGSPAARREVMLTAAKVTAEKGLDLGIVDLVCDNAAKTVEAAVRLGEEIVMRGCDGHVYGKIRESLLKEVLVHTIGLDESDSSWVRNIGSKL